MALLVNKVAVISGASSGLGRAIAMKFAAQGTRLIVCADVDEKARAEIERETAAPTHEVIQERYGRSRALFVKTDVRIAAQMETCIKIAADIGGVLDIIVNNAGGGLMGKKIADMSAAEWDSSMALNARGAFLGCQYACTQFLAQTPDSFGHRGAIVNSASIAGLVGLPTCAAYCASKAAVVNLSRTVAIDYASQGIRCNAICPGFIRTALMKLWFEDRSVATFMAASTPLVREDGLEQVANAAAFLASGEHAG